MNEKVYQEVKNAYADCWLNWVEGSKLRNLDFRASESVSKAEAKDIFSRYVPGGYNAFASELIDHLPEDSEITIAREGSVCIYVRSQELNASDHMQKLVASALDCDEFSYDADANEYRIWWD